MLIKLTLRNARQQIREYVLFTVTMIIAVAMLYSYNSFLFSDIIKKLMTLLSDVGEGGIAYIVVFYSLIIVFVVGWLMSYMLNFMLKKRSKELGTYLLLGLEKNQIAKMYVLENCLIGVLSLVVGVGVGIVISTLLEVFISSLYSSSYSMKVGFSPKAGGLTMVYFCLIYTLLLFASRRKLRKMKILSLLNYDRYNDMPRVKGKKVGIIIFIIALLCGLGSILLLIMQPFGDYTDMILGFLLIILCNFGILIGICPILYTFLDENKKWKYKHSNMFIFRTFVAKINKMVITLGMVASFFTIALVVLSTGVSYSNSVNELLRLSTFDLSILHPDEEYDFSKYNEYLMDTAELETSHSYSLYTKHEERFISERNDVLSDYFEKKDLIIEPNEYLYDENKFDTYMKYKDYNILRMMLGYNPVEIEENTYRIHCMPYLKEKFNSYATDKNVINISGHELAFAGISTEEFTQYDGYGNGQEFIIIVPDNLVDDMDVIYSLFVADMNETVDLEYLTNFKSSFQSLELLKVNYVEGYTSDSESSMTRLFAGEEVDYINGKFVILATQIEITLILSLIYLGLILCIAGAVILSVQFLSDNRNNCRRYTVLSNLGMDRTLQKETLLKQVLTYFLLPVIPTIVLSIGIVYSIVNSVIKDYFLVPVLESEIKSSMVVFAMTMGTFLIIYFIYIQISYKVAKKAIIK